MKTCFPEKSSEEKHLKMDGSNTNFLLGFGLFSGATFVSGRVKYLKKLFEKNFRKRLAGGFNPFKKYVR